VKRAVLAGAAGIALVAATMATAASSASAVPSALSGASRPTQLVVIDDVTDISFSAAPAPGVTFTSTADAVDTAGHTIGDSGGLCGVLTLDRTTLQATAYCNSIWTLPGGQIDVAELFPFLTGTPAGGTASNAGDEFDGIVSGGNGRYRGVRGDVHFQHVGNAPSGFFQFQLTFHLSY
jgi:hypothetical protein